MSNKDYYLLLNRIEGIGPRTVQRLLNHWPNLAALFSLSKNEMMAAGVNPLLATALSAADLRVIEADLQWEQQSPCHHLLCWEDENYPALLKEIHDPPLVLYGIGNLDCLKQKTLAMVGTRKPSVNGHETAYRFAFELAGKGISIVSGGALGVDAEAHRGSIAAKGQTIAVMGTGVDVIYPARHRDLVKNIITNGLILSEFPLGKPPSAGHFPRRNRIISGLSIATLVVEAAIKSGSLITARLALEQNRDVLAIPGSIHNPQARGCHYLLQQGARLVTSPADILDALGCNNLPNDAGGPALSLATNNKNLVKCIGFEITSIDQISQRSGIQIDEVACGLAELELQGIVKAVPGGYMRCY
ncbi:protein smf [Legionella birminghamensis]|uniref:Protein smf n=1 Tax=Legionella birminghamensis TaxID=28083 RepID=A0A378I720_9GAMM|nr:DNA-processing protein DprA [Legionella birminghamensis]KTC72510.1 protein smf [Legionella birminghamensis]STX30642.1 protein smf [Legionella birminghamensis]